MTQIDLFKQKNERTRSFWRFPPPLPSLLFLKVQTTVPGRERGEGGNCQSCRVSKKERRSNLFFWHNDSFLFIFLLLAIKVKKRNFNKISKGSINSPFRFRCSFSFFFFTNRNQLDTYNRVKWMGGCEFGVTLLIYLFFICYNLICGRFCSPFSFLCQESTFC